VSLSINCAFVGSLFKVIKSRFDNFMKHDSYFRVENPLGLESPRGFQEVKVPRFHDNGAGWW
jgi:hypothetical protein